MKSTPAATQLQRLMPHEKGINVWRLKLLATWSCNKQAQHTSNIVLQCIGAHMIGELSSIIYLKIY